MKTLLRITTTTAGYWLAISGGISIAIVLDHWTSYPAASDWRFMLPLLLFLVTMTASGVLVLRRKTIGVWLVAVTQLPQLPVVTNGSLAWVLLPAPAIEWMLFPRWGFEYSSSAEFTIAWAGSGYPFQISLNGAAVVLFAWAVRAVGALQLQKHEEVQW